MCLYLTSYAEIPINQNFFRAVDTLPDGDGWSRDGRTALMWPRGSMARLLCPTRPISKGVLARAQASDAGDKIEALAFYDHIVEGGVPVNTRDSFSSEMF